MYSMQPIIIDFDIKGFNNIYYFEFDKNFTHTPEKHNFWEMVYVDSGSVTAITDGNSCILEQGKIIFHQPGEIHAHISDLKAPNSMMVVSFTCDSPNMDFFSNKIFTADKTCQTLLSLFISETRNALGEIPSEYNDKSNLNFMNAKFGSTQLLLCYFTELLINILRTNSNFDNKIVSNEKSRAMAQSSICELMVDYMRENIYSGLSLPDICTHFMLGKSQISYIFKGYSGKSVMEYYNNLKIQEAKRLLRYGSKSISQISDMLKFSCIHSFSRAFKKAVGVSPSEYKKRII